MNINWFKNENHLVYINAEKDLANLEKQLKFPGLEDAATQLHETPTVEGLSIKGARRTMARLFIPDLVFGEHIEMGENIFLFLGEMNECYVIFWPAPAEKKGE